MPRANLIELNPALDLEKAGTEFAKFGRVQIVDFLTRNSALQLREILENETPWGLVWRGANMQEPELLRAEALHSLPPQHMASIRQTLSESMAGDEYAYCYSTYPLVQALLEQWDPGGIHEDILASLNQARILDAVRRVTGIQDIVKADGQATLYRPGHFLAVHDDQEVQKGRRVAYVINLSGDLSGKPWRPEWGGSLQFLNADGAPDQTFLPKFNAISLFAVPQRHHVTSVSFFAPSTRYSITGWFRDRI